MGAFNLSIGAILIGCSLNIYLYGLVSHQYLVYKTRKFDDPVWLRTLVAILFVVDTYQTVVELYGVWYFAIKNYANPKVLGEVIWVTPLCGISAAISTLIFQTFLINRLCRLTKQLWLGIFLIVTAVAAFICGIIDSTSAWLLADVTKFAVLIPLTIAWLSIEASVNIITSLILIRALWLCKIELTRANTMINRCIRAAIQSGLFSSVFAIFNFLVFIFWPTTYLYAIFHWPLGRIYSNCLMYTLIARKEIVETPDGTIKSRDTGSSAKSAHITSIRFSREVATDLVVDYGDLIPDKVIQPRDIVFLPHSTV
ncbi:hypothetical protein DL96DRAFT_1749632 [Flagelloscypha sp. PMI_526]|nr:hypothetical protein DL96DRAFT_1749632 [Flagelloscypha sp. PMI_526]